MISADTPSVVGAGLDWWGHNVARCHNDEDEAFDSYDKNEARDETSVVSELMADATFHALCSAPFWTKAAARMANWHYPYRKEPYDGLHELTVMNLQKTLVVMTDLASWDCLENGVDDSSRDACLVADVSRLATQSEPEHASRQMRPSSVVSINAEHH